jgi:uncharacterized membrane protein
MSTNKKHVHNLLLAFVTFIFMLILFRYVYTGSKAYLFLVWNLFLAYLPFGIAYQLHTKGKRRIAEAVTCGIIWVLLLPNAGYIITDFLHLGQSPVMPAWYDIVVLFSSSLAGILMGVISILWMQDYYTPLISEKVKNSLLVFICTLCGFGIYIGRYLRWNSWDVLHSPLAIWQECFTRIAHPTHHARTWGITLFFAVIHLFCFCFLNVWSGKKAL